MAGENKITYGLRNAHYAVITEEEDGTFTYGTPTRMPGSVSLSLDPSGETVEFYADDYEYFGEEVSTGYDGELEMARIMENFRQDVLGEELVNGVLYENADAKKNKFALLYEFQGDKNAIRHVLYNCKAARPSNGSSTKTNTKEPNTQTLSFTARPRPSDGEVKANTVGVPDVVYNDWYKAVHERDELPTV